MSKQPEQPYNHREHIESLMQLAMEAFGALVKSFFYGADFGVHKVPGYLIDKSYRKQ